MSAFSTTELFYELDERRVRSAEVDFGVWWRFEGDVFRLTWIVDTGELVVVRLAHGPRVRAMRIATHLQALEILFGGEPMEVYVLATIDDRDEVERTLAGWEHACEGPDSILWVLDRVAELLEIPPPAVTAERNEGGRWRRVPLLGRVGGA